MTRFPCYTVKDGQHPASHCQGPLWTKSRRVTRCHHQNGWQLAVLVGWLLNVLTYTIHCATDHHHHSSHRYWGNQDCSPYAAAFGCLSLSFLPVTLQQPEHADLTEPPESGLFTLTSMGTLKCVKVTQGNISLHTLTRSKNYTALHSTTLQLQTAV